MKKSSNRKLTRRNFVASGSAVVATIGFGGIGRADYAGLGHQKAAGLSIAYLQGSENWDYLHGLTPTLAATTDDMMVDEALLIGASTLASGDPRFAFQGARVTIHGLISEPSNKLPPMLLKTRFRPYHDTTHLAWDFEDFTRGDAQSGTAFTMPVNADSGVQLSLEMRPRGEELVSIAEAQFVLDATRGEAKLRRGAYLMTWGLPDAPMLSAWSGCRVIAEQIETPEEGMPETRRFMVIDATGAAVALAALMLTVDYGDGVPA